MEVANVNGPELAELVDQVMAQKRAETEKLVRSEASASYYRGRAESAERAFRIVSDELGHEAQSRNWCEEFNEFVERVNERISSEASNSMCRLEGTDQEYSVTLQVSMTVYASVTAKSEADARSKAENFDESDLRDGDFDQIDLDVTEVEVDRD